MSFWEAISPNSRLGGSLLGSRVAKWMCLNYLKQQDNGERYCMWGTARIPHFEADAQFWTDPSPHYYQIEEQVTGKLHVLEMG